VDRLKLGILGGTFDPPHLAHLMMGDVACNEIGLERILWVLTPDPPHKRDRKITPLDDRLAMVLASIRDDERFALSRVDIDRPSPHYAIDTVQLLRQEYPGAELTYVMGSDSLRDLPTWHDPVGFIDAVDRIGIIYRPGADLNLWALDSILPGLCDKIKVFESPLLDISSSEIRHLAANHGPFRYFVLPSVYQVIIDRKIYG
jgi:nicotinate-nucleotide adenylyltransferase